MHIFCDFDGTISVKDTTDVILSKLALPEWEAIEAEWKSGLIGSAECMQRQIALIRADRATLDATLDEIAIDPTFPDFLKFCERIGLPLSVLSDGVDYFINRILARHNINGLSVTANHLIISSDNSYSLTSPYRDSGCASNAGVCKCRAVELGREPRIYIGDGRSDFCAAGYADIVFAKGTLATFCEQQGIAYYLYESFDDIQRMLASLIPSVRHQQYSLFAPTASA